MALGTLFALAGIALIAAPSLGFAANAIFGTTS